MGATLREHRGVIGGALLGAAFLAWITPLGLIAAHQAHATNKVVLGLIGLGFVCLLAAILVFGLQPVMAGGSVGRTGYSATEIETMEKQRLEIKLRGHQAKILDDQLWLAQHQIRGHNWPIGQANNIELARVVTEWIDATREVVKTAVGDGEAVFFSLDVGDPGLVVGSPGSSELEVMKAIQQRHLERLDRHILRLQKVKERL